VTADDSLPVSTPAQFKALGHPMRHRLLLALGGGEATISQLAAALGSNKGNVAHHLKVLAQAGLVRPAGTRQVRGGTEQYYARTVAKLSFDDARLTGAAFQALAAEIDRAQPDPFLVLRTIRLRQEHAEQLAATLQALAEQPEDGPGQPRYGLLLGLYQAAGEADPAQPVESAGTDPVPPTG
jgi:DNA-binding transcriptional ArsR family regulator